eukprot:4717434-Pyramimonas_sp.AAC.1
MSRARGVGEGERRNRIAGLDQERTGGAEEASRRSMVCEGSSEDHAAIQVVHAVDACAACHEALAIATDIAEAWASVALDASFKEAYGVMLAAAKEWVLDRKHAAHAIANSFMQSVLAVMNGHLDSLNEIEVALLARDRANASLTLTDKAAFYAFATLPATKALLDLILWVRGQGSTIVAALSEMHGPAATEFHVAFQNDPIVARSAQ